MLTRNKFINYNLRLKNAEKLNMVFAELNLINKKSDQKNEFLSCLIANLIIYKKLGNELMVSRAKNYYATIPPKYKRDIQNYQTSIEVLGKMEENGYMVRQIGVMGQKPDTYVGTVKLFKILNDSTEIEECIQPVNIILRKNNNGKKSDVDYVDTASIIKLNNEVKLINDVRAKNKISLKSMPAGLIKDDSVLYFAEDMKTQRGLTDVDFRTSYLVRIFNEDFQHGGRFYRGAESNMPKLIRKHLTINGNKTVELDYKALHLNMLYHKEGIKLKIDPYDCKATPTHRSIFKLLALTCLNSVDEKKCIQAFREELKTGGLQSLLPDLTDKTLKPMLELFKDKHKKIAKYFFTGIGLELQNMDAEIAHEILLHFAKKGIMVMVVHDSFIIEKKHENELKSVMRKIYKQKLGFYPEIATS